jgi:hypothetical protein
LGAGGEALIGAAGSDYAPLTEAPGGLAHAESGAEKISFR